MRYFGLLLFTIAACSSDPSPVPLDAQAADAVDVASELAPDVARDTGGTLDTPDVVVVLDAPAAPDAAVDAALDVATDATPEAAMDAPFVCPTGQTLCAGLCVTTSSDMANCGGCGNVCMFEGASSSCVGGVCTFGACLSGHLNCDRDTTNGCEVDTQTNAMNCGRCGNTCVSEGGTGACVGGLCTLGACTDGFGNCDMNPANGCEVNLRSSAANCGGCGRACVPSGPRGVAVCARSLCRLSCDSGFGDCNGVTFDGCETDLTTVEHCGSCSNACTRGMLCIGGRCV